MFESEKKSEEWGREGLRSKLQAVEDLLSKERAEWKKVEEGQADRECVEAELKAQVSSKDKDLATKDMANSILNASELDAAVAALIDASRVVEHRGGYLECAHHVEEAFRQEFDVSHCLVTDQADAALAPVEKVYDHLSLPVMDLVTEALKHDDWCQRLKAILDPPQAVELSDEEETVGGDGDGDGDGGAGYE
ncbi:hypothetical protein Hanom_Chr13g01211041 [Helianthus anomalus]